MHSIVAFLSRIVRFFFAGKPPAPPRAKSPRRGLGFEGLESRETPSATIMGFDLDGDKYKIVLTGPGDIDPVEAPIEQLFVNNTTSSSSLTITVTKVLGGDGQLEIGDITIGGSIRGIAAPAVNIVGTGVNVIGSIASLSVRDVTLGAQIILGGSSTQSTRITAHVLQDDAIVSTTANLTTFTAAAFVSGEINAPTIGTLAIKGDARLGVLGDFGADLLLTGRTGLTTPTLKTVQIAHNLISSNWEIRGSVGAVTIGRQASEWTASITGNLASLKVVNMADSSISAEQIPLVTVTNNFASTTFEAARIGAVSLNRVITDNFPSSFGFYALESIQKVTARTPRFTFDPTDPLPQGIDYFVVQVGL